MEAKQPTDAEIKEFWEWCGLLPEPENTWVDITIDLNNFFKYAVPKLEEHSAPAVEYIMGKFCEAVYQHKDPALALFWAIYAVIAKSPPL